MISSYKNIWMSEFSFLNILTWGVCFHRGVDGVPFLLFCCGDVGILRSGINSLSISLKDNREALGKSFKCLHKKLSCLKICFQSDLYF